MRHVDGIEDRLACFHDGESTASRRKHIIWRIDDRIDAKDRVLRGGSELSCQQIQQILHPYIDRELDLVQSVEVERHLEQCETCELIHRGQVALRSSLQDPSFYYRAPAALKRRITSTSKR